MRDFLFYSFWKVSVLKEILTLDAAASWEIAVQHCYILWDILCGMLAFYANAML